MATGMQPTQTEYGHVVYRSKSEAVFARCLDLAGNLDFHKYEMHDAEEFWGHGFDFVLMKNWNWNQISGLPFIVNILIEFKPACPTKAYIENLIDKTRDKMQARHNRAIPVLDESYIVWGSPWNGPHESTGTTYNVIPLFTLRRMKPNEAHSVWGSFFTDSMLAFYREEYFGEKVFASPWHSAEWLLGITEDHVQEAMRYRFDLKQEVSSYQI